jgi:Prokaryotic N-terminal methylation motif
MRRRVGFTLIELMLAMAMFVLIMIISFLPYRLLKRAYQLGTGHMDASAAARVAIRRMTDELCSANPLPSPTATPAIAPPTGKSYEPFVRPMFSSPVTIGGSTVYQQVSVYHYNTSWTQTPAWTSGTNSNSVVTLYKVSYYLQQLTTVAAASPAVPWAVGDVLPTTTLSSGSTYAEYSLIRSQQDVVADYSQTPPVFGVTGTPTIKRIIPRGIAGYSSGSSSIATFYFSPVPQSTPPSSSVEVPIYVGMYPDQYQRPLPTIGAGSAPPLQFGTAFRVNNVSTLPW